MTSRIRSFERTVGVRDVGSEKNKKRFRLRVLVLSIKGVTVRGFGSVRFGSVDINGYIKYLSELTKWIVNLLKN